MLSLARHLFTETINVKNHHAEDLQDCIDILQLLLVHPISQYFLELVIMH